MRGTCTVNGKSTTFGFFEFSDWLDSVLLSFPGPWAVAPLDGKYYGTKILDATGGSILGVWMSIGNPSARELRGEDRIEWLKECFDSHWESEVALHLAGAVVAARNVANNNNDRPMEVVRPLVMQFFEWDMRVWEQVRVGGPHRRALPTDPEIQAIVGRR